MNRIPALDPDARMAHVGPGVTNDTPRNAAKAHALTFAPDSATHEIAHFSVTSATIRVAPTPVMGGKTVHAIRGEMRLVPGILDSEVLTSRGRGRLPRHRLASVVEILEAWLTSARYQRIDDAGYAFLDTERRVLAAHLRSHKTWVH